MKKVILFGAVCAGMVLILIYRDALRYAAELLMYFNGVIIGYIIWSIPKFKKDKVNKFFYSEGYVYKADNKLKVPLTYMEIYGTSTEQKSLGNYVAKLLNNDIQ